MKGAASIHGGEPRQHAGAAGCAGREDFFRCRLQVKTIADIERFEQIPLAERRLPAGTYDLLRSGCLRSPQAPALHYFPSGDELERAVTVSHGELFARITQTANLLHSLGIGPTDVVGILMPITPESQYAIWGSQASGIACPISWMLEPEIIRALLLAADAKAVIVYGPDDEIDAWNKIMLIRDGLPGVRHVIRAGGGDAARADVLDLLAEMEKFPADRLVSKRRFRPQDTAALFHTGGTTGTPKLARQTHANLVFAAWAVVIQYDMQPSDVRVFGVPMFHVTGVNTSCLMPFICGASVVMPTATGWRNPSVIRNIWRIVERFRVTSLSMVPTVANMLLNVPKGRADLSSLKTVVCGTAPLATAVADAFSRYTGAGVIEGYGLTESTALSACNPRYGEARIGSVGLRLIYQQMKAVKIESGRIVRDCAPGEAGAIVIRGPNVFAGYLDKGQNEKLWFDGGWFNTGDLGYADADQYFWLTGRAKDLIIRGGHNIDPRMIEEAMYHHPAVRDAAAVGVPDAHAGELPVVYVELKAGVHTPPGRLKHYAYEAIPERAAVPKHIYVIDSMPRTAIGKIQKNALRRMAVASAQERMLAGLADLPRPTIHVTDRGDAGLHSTIVFPAGLSHDVRQNIEEQVRNALATLTTKYQVVYE